MTYLDPQQQLIQARGLMQPAGPNSPMGTGSSYVNEVERQASQTAAGIINFGTNAMVGAPMVASMGFGLMSMAGVGGAAGKLLRGGDIGMSMLDPFGAAFEAIPKALAGKISLAGAGFALAGAYGTSKVIGGTADFIRNSMLEGQRDYLATRTLMRQMPQSGYGPQSVLSMGMGSPRHFGSNQLSQMNSQIRSVAADYGMSMGQARNQLSSMNQMGMIDTSSVSRISQSFRKSLQELKSVAQQIGGDIKEAQAVYQALDRMGFKSASGRSSMLNSMTTTSSLTGMSLGQVGGHMAPILGMAKNMGLSQETGGQLAMRSLQTTAYMKASGMISGTDISDAGGISGYAQKMSAIHLQTLGSRGATAMMSNVFASHGGMKSGALSDLMSGKKMQVNYAGLRNLDPYALEGMQEDMSDMTGAAIMARVSAINQKHANDPLKARQTQFKFLQSMGIGSAKDQMQYLNYLRAQPGSDFAASLQGLRNNALTSRDSGINNAQSISGVFEDTINEITRRLKTTFSRAGEALTRDFEQSNRRVSMALEGRRRDYGTGVADMGAMRAVARDIMHGGSYSGVDNRYLERRLANSANLRDAMSASVNLSGIDNRVRSQLLQGPMDYLAYGSARGSSMIGDLFKSSISRGLEALTGEPLFAGRSSGALGERLPGGLNTGELQLGYSRRGRRVSASPMDYMRMVGQDLGVELERSYAANGTPLGMRVVRPDDAAVNILMKNRGGDFDRAWGGGDIMDLRKRLQGNDYLMSALGAGGIGMAGGASLGMGIGGFLGSFAGGIGALPGAVVGAAIGGGIGALGGVAGFTGQKGMQELAGLGGAGIGAVLGTAALPVIGTVIGGVAGYYLGDELGKASGWWSEVGGDLIKGTDSLLGTDMTGFFNDSGLSDLYAGGAKQVLDKYSDSVGVAGDTRLSAQQKRMLGRSYGKLASLGTFDEVATALFSVPGTSQKISYKSLDAQQRAIMREVIRRRGGAMGEALAGGKAGGNLSTEQFNSILSQEKGRNFAGAFFGVGGSGERQLQIAEGRQGGGLDISAVGMALSDEELERLSSLANTRGLSVGSMQGRRGSGAEMNAPGALSYSGRVNRHLRSLGDRTASAAWRGLRELAGGSQDILNLATRRSGGRMVINEGSINDALAEISRREGVNPDDVEKVRAAFMRSIRSSRAGRGSAASFLTGNADMVSQERPSLGIYQGMGGKGFLASGLLTKDGMRVSEEGLGIASGVSAGLSNLLEEARGGAARGTGMDAAIEAAIKKTAGDEFFTDKQAVTSLGALLELSATRAARGDQSPLKTRTAALERLKELEGRGVISESRANLLRANQDLAFGNLRSGSMGTLMSNIEGLSDEQIAQYQEQATAMGDMYKYSAASSFRAARNNQVRNLMIRERGRRSGDFRTLVEALGGSKFGDTGAIAKLRSTLKGVSGGNELDFLKGQGGSMGENQIADVRAQLEARMTDKTLSESERRELQQISSQLGVMERLAFGSDNFGALAASATQGAITFGQGGQLQLDTGVLGRQMGHVIGPNRAMAIATQSESIKGLQQLMSGKLRGEKHADKRRGLLEKIAEADADTEAGRARQVLGHFGYGGRTPESDEDAVNMMNRLVRDTSDVRGNEELKTAFEESLNRVFANFIGQGDEKKAEKDNATKAVLAIKDVIANAQILKGNPPIVHVDNAFMDF